MWYGLVDPATGTLVSVGTEAMFPEGNLDAFDGTYDVVEFGPDRPDFSAKIWSSTLRQLIDRPPPVLISRLDDYEAWLMADPDFALAWSGINAARRAQIRLGVRRVLQRLLGPQVNRHESETPEI
jgi:hypothetical protein